MFAVADPNLIIGGFGLSFLAFAALWRLIAWVREAPQTPDPWDAEVEQQLQNPETREICHRCMTPHEPGVWFCQHCGAAVGPYNNLMPFLNVFSEGEVLRNGISDRFRNRPFIAAGYLLIMASIFLSMVVNYPLVAAGIFLFFGFSFLVSVLRNLKRPPEGREPLDSSSSGIS
jgi:hypothetical protein